MGPILGPYSISNVSAKAVQAIRFFCSVFFPLLLIFLAWGFADYAFSRGTRIFGSDEIYSRLWHENALFSNAAIYGHMIAGAVITAAAPLQLIPVIRKYVPLVHKVLGYLIATLSLLAAIGGLFYIVRNGTIGGTVMNWGFGLYGVLMLVAAAQTLRFARSRDPRHFQWGARLVVLALGSWIYRVHYTLWQTFMGGAYSQYDFQGAFDLVQTVAFYLPYLLLLELWFWLHSEPPTFSAGSKSKATS
ncbi:DUF2306 domain-containing protein [Cognatishimia sp.]|uniref:DUF2306 domain-containing protein n=1 Tax=Cognatishimia sp. TaxID=2211648 RepID=UPI0035144FB3|nr:DUF2306 domain-containing protein [Cognatishimia sp.]